MAYEIPGLTPWASALIVLELWTVLTQRIEPELTAQRKGNGPL